MNCIKTGHGELIIYENDDVKIDGLGCDVALLHHKAEYKENEEYVLEIKVRGLLKEHAEQLFETWTKEE